MENVRQVFDLTQKLNQMTAEVVVGLFTGKTGKVGLDLTDDDGNITYKVEVKTVRARRARTAKKATTTTRRKVAKRATKKTTTRRKKATRRTK